MHTLEKDRTGGDARQEPIGGGKLLLPEEGVTRDNLQKWEPQNIDRYADCQNMSADKVGDCKVLAGDHITSQHKPLINEMWIERSKQRWR